MPIQKLIHYLDENFVEFIVITHSRAYTSQGIAAIAHISGNELAKTVMLSVDGQLCMAVLPASKQVNLDVFAKLTGAKNVWLASEHDFRDCFPDCEVGAMPPFGNLYGIRVYADVSLTHDKEIAFNAGSHRELIRLAYSEYERLVEPIVLDFANRSAVHAA